MIPLTRGCPERIKGGYDDALYKSTFTLLFLLTLLRRTKNVVFNGNSTEHFTGDAMESPWKISHVSPVEFHWV